MPVFLEPYKNYTRLTRGTNKSLRPWYYSNPGDNDAIMGIGGNNTNKSVPSAPNYNTWLTPFDSNGTCLLYTSPSPRDRQKSRMPSSA